MWKLLYDSVRGTSHVTTGQECQDSSLARCLDLGEQQVLIAACADGAGSAARSEVGSRLACGTFLQLASAALLGGQSVEALTRDTAVLWRNRIAAAVNEEAQRLETTPRELASTFLGAIIGETCAAFLQIGDGGMVVLDGAEHRPVFWPQNGEYLNTTNFVTDADADSTLLFELVPRRVDELALFSDGLELLVLDFAAHGAYAPFFAPLFKALRHAEDVAALAAPFRAFLDSPSINERTDDDKTLILATRVNGDGAAIL